MKQYFQRLLAHETWANQTLLTALMKETAVPQRAKDTFAHICSAPEYWLRRIKGEQIKEYEWWPPFDANSLEQRIQTNELFWNEYLGSLSEPVEDIRVNTLSYKGEALEFRAMDLLTQFHNHSCHHRGQIAILFRDAGLEPVVTDFIMWARMIEKS